MASSAPPPAVLFILLILVLAAAGTTSGIPVSIANYCPYTIWPAILPQGLGRELRPGTNWTLDMPPTGGYIWGRTGCSFDASGKGRPCESGDCGGSSAGLLRCKDQPGTPLFAGPERVTKAEFSKDPWTNNYQYDINQWPVFNVPLDLGCSTGDYLRCRKDFCEDGFPATKFNTHVCPDDGRVSFQIVFCGTA